MVNLLACRLEPLTQTLFSAHLIAEVLPRIWKLDPVEGEKRLEELTRLTFDVLSEMNALRADLEMMKDAPDAAHAPTNDEEN